MLYYIGIKKIKNNDLFQPLEISTNAPKRIQGKKTTCSKNKDDFNLLQTSVQTNPHIVRLYLDPPWFF
jgi:hypothetical protein